MGGGAWKTRGRPWPRERVDGACARRDGAKRKVFQVPPPNAGQDGRSGEGFFGEDGVGVDVKEDLAELGTVKGLGELANLVGDVLLKVSLLLKGVL